MLKRVQVLLDEWQVEHYKLTAQKYDVSFSEMIRMALCMDILSSTKIAFPKYSYKLNDTLLRKSIKTHRIDKTMVPEVFHQFLSKVYFEARKAAEYRDKMIVNQVKNNNKR